MDSTLIIFGIITIISFCCITTFGIAGYEGRWKKKWPIVGSGISWLIAAINVLLFFGYVGESTIGMLLFVLFLSPTIYFFYFQKNLIVINNLREKYIKEKDDEK
ncbi:MAG: hypothetical protein PHY40_02160 [Patescibacteria group bacterium]|nr:hypothetical protein [Patescibacteria group bacterium]